MQRPLRPPSAVATGSDVWQRIAHRRGQNHEDIHLPATTPAQCDAAHDPCRVQGRQAHAWRLRRGAVARDPADPRQAKKAARGLMLRCGTWRARASKSTRASTEERARRSLKKHVFVPVFGGFLRNRSGVTACVRTRVKRCGAVLDRAHPPKHDATIYALTSLMLNDLRALPNAPPCYFTSLGTHVSEARRPVRRALLLFLQAAP